MIGWIAAPASPRMNPGRSIRCWEPVMAQGRFFQLRKIYGSGFAPYERVISKPVATSVRAAIDATEGVAGIDFAVDGSSGLVSFFAAPPSGATVTAGFSFDVPVRFDTDALDIDSLGLRGGRRPAYSDGGIVALTGPSSSSTPFRIFDHA